MVGVGQQRHVREDVVLVQTHHLVGTGPAEIDTAASRESLCPFGDYVHHRLARLATRERGAFRNAHECPLSADIGVPHLSVRGYLLEMRARDTVELLGLA